MMNDEIMPSRVLVALSGGVDSAVAAALLAEAGHEVVGVMLHLWMPPQCHVVNRCCSPEAVERARHLAARIGFPFHVLDVAEEFKQTIVDPFVADSAAGRTPNPCVHCNARLRWRVLLERAAAFGADRIATGHYARIDAGDDGKMSLLRGLDREKDQSYMLAGLGPDELRRTLLPLGGLTKTEVRRLAAARNLPCAETPESQDLCFMGDASPGEFVASRAPEAARPGDVLTRDGRVLGAHRGIASVTIGQRHGLGIPAGEALYVIEKSAVSNRVIVGTNDETHRSVFEVEAARWIAGAPPPGSITAAIEVRYRARPLTGKVTPLAADRFRVELEQPARAVTPGQVAVLYIGEAVIGSGTIAA
jgi:tRNA-specific 2-thiouridylase